MEYDLLNPSLENQQRSHKLKRLVQAPNSYFMDVKCSQKCAKIATIFSHAQTTITCDSCQAILCKPTGGKVKLTPGCAFKVRN